MAQDAKNSTIAGQDAHAERMKKDALRILAEVFDREHAAKTYGTVGVEIQFDNGDPKVIRRLVDATHK